MGQPDLYLTMQGLINDLIIASIGVVSLGEAICLTYIIFYSIFGAVHR